MFDEDAVCKENYERLEKIATKQGYVFNPNQDWVDQVIRLMTNNLKEYGKFYCPCKQHYPVDPKNDVVCPCADLEQEMASDGYCHCRLFYKKGVKKEKMDILKTVTCPG